VLASRKARELADLNVLYVVAAGYVIWRYLPILALPLIAVVAFVGGWVVWRRSTGADLVTGWLTPRRLACYVGFTVVTLLIWTLYYKSPRMAVAGALIAIEALFYVTAPRESDGPNWWSHRNLVDLLIKAKVLAPLREGDRPYAISYRAPVRRDEDGTTTVPFELPPGVHYKAATDRRAQIAACIPGAVDRLVEVSHSEDDPATAITIRVRSNLAPKVLPAVVPDRTDFRQHVALGTDARGKQVEYLTAERHTMVVGATGSGKTVLGRWVAMHALLDPTVQVGMIVGKDDLDDWTAAAPLCALGYVGGLGAAEVAQVEPMLTRLTEINESRKTLPRGAASLMFVVVEEWYAIRGRIASNDPKAGERVDTLYGELLATARSRGIIFLTLSQRGLVTHITSDQRTNMVQRLVGSVTDPGDARHALGYTPDQLPRGKGQFLYSDRDSKGSMVQVPFLTDEQWVAGCARAAELRGLAKPSLVETSPASAEPDPLELAVVVALEDAPLSATKLLKEIPDAPWKPADPQALGIALRRYRDAGLTKQVRDGKSWSWALARPPQQPPAAPAQPSLTLTAAPAASPAELSRRSRHARPGPRPHLSRALGAPLQRQP
jgi:hypothetical protein